jgi:hypothetical protein
MRDRHARHQTARALSPKLQSFVQTQSYFQDLSPIVVK